MLKKFVQKWNMFRADFGEYMRLCRRCRELGRDVFKKRDAISVAYELGRDVKEPYCIKSVMVVFGEHTDEFSVPRKNEFVVNLCPDYNDAEKCAAAACPRCAQKREYDRVVAEYQAAVSARYAFWRNRANNNSK
ncbi:hypothetical protein HDR66_02075 [bacterium]|nr:hypothetical protein [bacterium]